MAEWSNAHDSKSCYGQLYGGSNPSLCAKNRVGTLSTDSVFVMYFFERDSRVETRAGASGLR